MKWPEKAESVYRSMKNPHSSTNIGHLLDGMVYLVARHFKISMVEAARMEPDEFGKSFAWATAASRFEAEEMESATGDVKQKSRIGKTDTGRPFPGSEPWSGE